MKPLATLLFSLALSCSASTRLLFTLSHTDGNTYQFTWNNVQDPTFIGCCQHVGTNAPAWDGHVYSIRVNVVYPELLRDGQVIGPIMWGNNNVDVTTHYGFCIANGQGYLACQYNDGDPTIFFFQLNLITAEATFMGFVGPSSPTFSVGGMEVQPY